MEKGPPYQGSGQWNGLPGTETLTRVGNRARLLERLWAAMEALPVAEPAGKPHSKQAAVIAMLRRPAGATVDEMMAATGWQPHTVRGLLAGALKKKLGLAVTSSKEDRGRVYRIADAASL